MQNNGEQGQPIKAKSHSAGEIYPYTLSRSQAIGSTKASAGADNKGEKPQKLQPSGTTKSTVRVAVPESKADDLERKEKHKSTNMFTRSQSIATFSSPSITTSKKGSVDTHQVSAHVNRIEAQKDTNNRSGFFLSSESMKEEPEGDNKKTKTGSPHSPHRIVKQTDIGQKSMSVEPLPVKKDCDEKPMGISLSFAQLRQHIKEKHHDLHRRIFTIMDLEKAPANYKEFSWQTHRSLLAIVETDIGQKLSSAHQTLLSVLQALLDNFIEPVFLKYRQKIADENQAENVRSYFISLLEKTLWLIKAHEQIKNEEKEAHNTVHKHEGKSIKIPLFTRKTQPKMERSPSSEGLPGIIVDPFYKKAQSICFLYNFFAYSFAQENPLAVFLDFIREDLSKNGKKEDYCRALGLMEMSLQEALMEYDKKSILSLNKDNLIDCEQSPRYQQLGDMLKSFLCQETILRKVVDYLHLLENYHTSLFSCKSDGLKKRSDIAKVYPKIASGAQELVIYIEIKSKLHNELTTVIDNYNKKLSPRREALINEGANYHRIKEKALTGAVVKQNEEIENLVRDILKKMVPNEQTYNFQELDELFKKLSQEQFDESREQNKRLGL